MRQGGIDEYEDINPCTFKAMNIDSNMVYDVTSLWFPLVSRINRCNDIGIGWGVRLRNCNVAFQR